MKCDTCTQSDTFPYCDKCIKEKQTSLFDEEEQMLNNYKFIFETEARTAIHRKGLDDLLTFLSVSDFFTAPASTKYHGACEYGLVKHSLAVFENFWKIAPVFGFTHTKENDESAAIVCLFHDICKANFYKQSYRNVKDEETGKWLKVPSYTIEEVLPFGSHGGKSMYLVQKYISLFDDEAMAIYHHMGAWDKSNYNDPGKAYSNNLLAWLLHVADEASTYVDDE